MNEIIEGWYWIKINDCPWEAAHWVAGDWEIVGSDNPPRRMDKIEIGPRIPTPDESAKKRVNLVTSGVSESRLQDMWAGSLAKAIKARDSE